MAEVFTRFTSGEILGVKVIPRMPAELMTTFKFSSYCYTHVPPRSSNNLALTSPLVSPKDRLVEEPEGISGERLRKSPFRVFDLLGKLRTAVYEL